MVKSCNKEPVQYSKVLDMFTEGNSRFAVYGLFRFFVEVECNNKENKFIVLKSFVTGKIMDKYSELSSWDSVQLKKYSQNFKIMILQLYYKMK